jgi:dihydroorotase
VGGWLPGWQSGWVAFLVPVACLAACNKLLLRTAMELSSAALLPPCPQPIADKVTLRRQPWTVPASYEFGGSEVVPMWAGQECPWTVIDA